VNKMEELEVINATEEEVDELLSTEAIEELSNGKGEDEDE